MLEDVLPYLLLGVPAALIAIVGCRLCVSGRGVKTVVGAAMAMVYPLIWFFGRDIYQFYRLNQYANRFQQLQHPPGTSLVASHRGSPHYGANDCGYFVGELREYSGERQQVIDFYADQEREGLFSEHLYLLFEEDLSEWDDFSKLYGSKYEISHSWDLSPSDLEGDRYIVYFAYQGNAYFDYRCH